MQVNKTTKTGPVAQFIAMADAPGFCREFGLMDGRHEDGRSRCDRFPDCAACISQFLSEFYRTASSKNLLQCPETRNTPFPRPERAREKTFCQGCTHNTRPNEINGHVSMDREHMDITCLKCRRHEYWENSWDWKPDLWKKEQKGKNRESKD